MEDQYSGRLAQIAEAIGATQGTPGARILSRKTIKMGLKEVADYRHLQREGIKCCRGGRWKASVQAFEMTLSRRSARAKRHLLDRTYKPWKTNDFYIDERGKRRFIRAHSINDRQVYKSFCTYEMKPAIKNYILDQNNASQVDKGTDRSIKQFRKDLARAYKKFGRDFYVITYDYHDYFGSLDHELIRENIHVSDDTFWILDEYVDIFERMDGKFYGVGIGGEPSQDIAVAYCAKIHRALTCDPTVFAAGWYMDDGYVITHTKREAQVVLSNITAASIQHNIRLNWKRTKIFWMEKDSVVWLKKRTFLTETGKIVMRLTRKNITDEIHRLNEYKFLYSQGAISLEPAAQSIMCWCTYAKPYKSNEAMIRVIKYFCNKFDIPWSVGKLLLRRRKTGWMKEVLSTNCERLKIA